MLLNGAVVGEQDAPKAFANRGFLVADGVFESMRVTDGHVPFLGLHVARLHAALDAHGMNVPDSLRAVKPGGLEADWAPTEMHASA